MRVPFPRALIVLCLLSACGGEEPAATEKPRAVACHYAKAVKGRICTTGVASSFACTAGGGTPVDACPTPAALECKGTAGDTFLYDQEMVDLYRMYNPSNPCSVYQARG